MDAKRNKMKTIFTLICTASLVCMAGYWYQKYAIIDRDIGVVDYILIKDAKEEAKVFVVSLCFLNPFIPEILIENNSAIYSVFLEYLYRGYKLNLNAIKTDYKNVTLDLSDYFLSSFEKWRNESLRRNGSFMPDHTNHFNGYYEDALIKCFELKSDMDGHRHVSDVIFNYDIMKLNDTFLKYMKYISGESDEFPMYFKIHYPAQFMLGDGPIPFVYNANRKTLGCETSYNGIYKVIVNEIEILKSRSTKRRNCLSNQEDYDKKVMLEHIARKGCRDPFLEKHQSFPLCNTMEEITTNRFDYHSPDTLGIPYACERMSKMRFDVQTFPQKLDPEQPNLDVCNIWTFHISYPKEIRIITQSQEVDIHTLIGNIGGYLGLFLGKKDY